MSLIRLENVIKDWIIHIYVGNRGLPWFIFLAFLVKETSGILIFGPSFRKPSPDDAFRAGLRKLGPKINIPEVSLTRKAKNISMFVIPLHICPHN